MRMVRDMRALGVLGTAVCAAMLTLVCMVAVAPAYAENVQMQAPTTVSDDITRLHVNKLDADTHEYVSGATLAIINEETGEVVDSWVSGTTAHENEKGLDVDVVYILRELQAPEGYGTVGDVRFVVNETEGTGITILTKGDDAELVQSYRVNLYDKAGEAQTTTTVSKTSNSSSTSKVVAPKTGDETPLTTIASLVIVGILLIMLLQIPKRRLDDDEE